jgi:hypothetical protein
LDIDWVQIVTLCQKKFDIHWRKLSPYINCKKAFSSVVL